MTTTVHVAVGTAIGAQMGSPILGFFIGLIAHLLVDIIPHGDTKLSENYRHKTDKKAKVKAKKIGYLYVILDIIIAFYLLLTVLNVVEINHMAAFTATIAGSVLPDLLVVLYDITKSKYLKWFFDLHFFFHDKILAKHIGDMKLWQGITYQSILVIILLQII